MAEKNQVYKCAACGNIVEVLHGGEGELVCCGEAMQLMEENTVDAALEKHVPVIEKTDNGYKVTVGSVPHPMEEKHYIEWIELIAGQTVYRQNLQPGDAPEAFFCTDAENVTAREYCNIAICMATGRRHNFFGTGYHSIIHTLGSPYQPMPFFITVIPVS